MFPWNAGREYDKKRNVVQEGGEGVEQGAGEGPVGI